MATIRLVGEDQATGTAKAVYDDIEVVMGSGQHKCLDGLMGEPDVRVR